MWYYYKDTMRVIQDKGNLTGSSNKPEMNHRKNRQLEVIRETAYGISFHKLIRPNI